MEYQIDPKLVEADKIRQQLQNWLYDKYVYDERILYAWVTYTDVTLEIGVGDWCLWYDQGDSSDDFNFEFCKAELIKVAGGLALLLKDDNEPSKV